VYIYLKQQESQNMEVGRDYGKWVKDLQVFIIVRKRHRFSLEEVSINGWCANILAEMTHLCQFSGVLSHQRRVDCDLSRSEGRCSDKFKCRVAA
jgi:hypothetical protein